MMNRDLQHIIQLIPLMHLSMICFVTVCKPQRSIFDFCLNELSEVNSVTKIFVITVKMLRSAASCIRDQDATTAPARHM